MKFSLITVTITLLVLAACGGKKGNDIVVSGSNGEILPDCTGFKSEMIIPHGFTGAVSSKMGGKTFAKLTAVDSVDGTMKITISPPDGQSFPIDFIKEFKDYKLRFIACREDISSVSSGANTTGVCSRSGSINLIGNNIVSEDNFTNAGLSSNGINIHATRDPLYDSAYNYTLKPDFIMLTVSYFEEDQLGQMMIAYGRSPYYTGCYNK